MNTINPFYAARRIRPEVATMTRPEVAYPRYARLGDYSDREAGFVPLTFHTKRLAFAAGLRQGCTDIIRFSHGASSSRKVYRSSFIPGLHDTCMIFEKVK